MTDKSECVVCGEKYWFYSDSPDSIQTKLFHNKWAGEVLVHASACITKDVVRMKNELERMYRGDEEEVDIEDKEPKNPDDHHQRRVE